MRPRFTLGPAMWAWISTAPAMTVLPAASMTFAAELTLSAIFPSLIAISFLSPLIPWTGSKTWPFLMINSDMLCHPLELFQAVTDLDEELLVSEHPLGRLDYL